MKFRAPTGRLSAFAAIALAVMVLIPLAAIASGGGRQFDADLKPVPHNHEADGGSQVTGDVDIKAGQHRVWVEVDAKGLSPNLVHAQHIHGVASNECPGPEARNDRVADGLIDTTEGAPAYGPIVVSLTTKGDTSPDSGLAVNRFPVANRNGRLHYERSFKIGEGFPRKVARNLNDFHVVIHGIDTNHNEAYDFSVGKSDLDPSLPQEATVPATCGLIEHDHS